MSSEVKRPSWVPPIVAIISIFLSLTIFLVDSFKFSPALYAAYIFTPFFPILALAVARSNDTKARSNVFYDLAKGKKIVTFSLVFAIVGFIVALPVMFEIANRLSQI
jgi:hypothetical protein